MSLDLLKAATQNGEIIAHCQRIGASSIDIGSIIQIIQKYGTLAEQLLAVVLPLVPAGGSLAVVLDGVLKLLQVLVPTT